MSQKVDLSGMFGGGQDQQMQRPPMGQGYSGASSVRRGSVSSRSDFGQSGSPAMQNRRRPMYNPGATAGGMPPSTYSAPVMSPSPSMPAHAYNPYGGMPAAPAMPMAGGMNNMGAAPQAYGASPEGGGFSSFYDQMPGGGAASGYGGQVPYSGGNYQRGATAPSVPMGGGGSSMSSLQHYGTNMGVPDISGYDMPDAPSQYDMQRHLNTLGWGQKGDGSHNPWRRYKPEPVFEPLSEKITMPAQDYQHMVGMELAFLSDSYRHLATVPDAPVTVEDMQAKQESFKPLEDERNQANAYNTELRTTESEVGMLGDELEGENLRGEPPKISQPNEASTSFLGWVEELITINVGKGDDLYFKDNPHREQTSTVRSPSNINPPHARKNVRIDEQPSRLQPVAQDSSPVELHHIPPPKVQPYRAPEGVVLSPMRAGR